VLVGTTLHDLFVDDAQQRVNPELVRLQREAARVARTGERRPPRGGRRPRVSHLTPSRVEVVERLDRSGLLPAIVLVFSRAGCDAAAEHALRAGVRLTTAAEAAEVERVVAEAGRGLAEEDRALLAFDQWRATLLRGVAAHHAGLLPVFKQTVEQLFVRGLLKVVYATETLALGINMPARSVVLERLVKWNGEQHADVTPGEYTQLTGRAGRRGIDVEGHAVVLWQPDLDPVALAGLAATRTYPLRSSFRPSYNMAVNLVHQMGRDRARRLLESSFAQFQADRAAVGLAARRRRLSEAIAGYTEAMVCDRGDVADYDAVRRRLGDAEAQAARARRAEHSERAATAVSRLRVGDVVEIPTGKARGLAVVIEPAGRGADARPPLVLTESRQVRRLGPGDARRPPTTLTRVAVPRSFDVRVPAARRALVSAAREAARAAPPATSPRGPSRPPPDDRVLALREQLRAHPVHRCPDREEHLRWADRRWALQREHDRLQSSLQRRTSSVAAAFDRVCAVLDELGYLEGDEVTPAGELLRGLFGELDLLAAECLREGIWEGLHPPAVAACVSALTYRSRGGDDASPPHLPPGPVRPVLEQMVALWGELREVESRHRVDALPEPDLGFTHAVDRWVAGQSLAAVLYEADLTPGDFVRAARQVLDSLDQVAGVTVGGGVHAAARAAATALDRGVVAYAVPD
jgi:ATP-dependent RNA helicase HelY